MKKTMVFLLALMVWGVKNANAQLMKQWVDITAGVDVASKIRIDSQGNVYSLVIKQFPERAMLTQKRSANGTLLWQDSLVHPSIFARDMQVDAAGNVYSFGKGVDSSAWLVKYSSSGVQQWVSTLPSDFFRGPGRIRIDNAGNVVLVYTSFDIIACIDTFQQAYNVVGFGIHFLKLDGGGNVVMNFHYQPRNCNNGQFYIAEDKTPFDIDASGNIYCSYITLNQLNNLSYNVMKVNTSGGIDWNNVYYSRFYPPNFYSFQSLDLKYDVVTQHVLTAIGNLDSSSTHPSPYLTAIDNSGAFLWNNSDPNGHYASRIETDGSGNVYWGYYPYPAPIGGGPNFTIKKVSPAGSSLWSVVAAGAVYAEVSLLPDYDQSPGYTVDNAGNLYYVEGNNNQSDSIHINKISPAGNPEWQCVKAQTSSYTHWFTNDNNGNLYYYSGEFIAKYNPCTLPTQPGNITVTGGIAKVCPGETRTYTTPNAAGVTWSWTMPIGATINSGQGTRTISVTYDANFIATGTISVVKVSACGSSVPRTLSISRNNPTATITTNGGPTTFCSGTNPLILNANAGTGFTYQWKKGSTTLAGATNQSYVPTATSTAYKVIVTNAPGCSKTSATAAVTVNPLPAATITPQGPTTFCAGGSVVLQANSGTGLTYQWKKGAALISGATQQNKTVTTAGTYKVIVTNANSCSKTSPGTVVTVNCRESGEEIASTALEVFPNPTNGMVTLKFSSEENQTCDLIITDITGREVMKQQITASEGENEMTVDMGNLVKGNYFMKLKTKAGESVRTIILL